MISSASGLFLMGQSPWLTLPIGVCVSAYLCAWVFLTYTHMHVRVCTCMHVWTYLHVCVYMCACTYMCVCVCMCACMCVRVPVHLHACLCVPAHTHVCSTACLSHQRLTIPCCSRSGAAGQLLGTPAPLPRRGAAGRAAQPPPRRAPSQALYSPSRTGSYPISNPW